MKDSNTPEEIFENNTKNSWWITQQLFWNKVATILSLWEEDLLNRWKEFIEFLESSVEDFYMFTMLYSKKWDLRSIWFISQLKSFWDFTQEELSIFFSIVTEEYNETLDVLNKLEVWLWSLTMKDILKYYFVFKWMDDEYLKVFASYSDKHKLRKLIEDSTELNREYDYNYISECLVQLWKEMSVENILWYTSNYKIRFKEQKIENFSEKWDLSYDDWEPQVLISSQEEFKKVWESKHFLPHGIFKYNMWWHHSYKERIDPNLIVWTFYSWFPGWFWGNWNWKFSTEKIYWYSLKMLEGSWDYDTFQSDSVKLVKLIWPDRKNIYIVWSNWNHRTSVAKIVWLPFFDAEVKNYTVSKIILENKKMIKDFRNRINLWLIDWDINWDTLTVSSTLFDWVDLPKKELFKYIDFYESMYPWSFDIYRDKLALV